MPKISIEEEQGDGIAAFVGESIDAYADGGMVMEFPQNIPVKNSKATKDKSKKFVQRAAANKADKIQELAESLTIQQKIAIEILGKTGLSLKKWTYESLPVNPDHWQYEIKEDTKEQYDVQFKFVMKFPNKKFTGKKK